MQLFIDLFFAGIPASSFEGERMCRIGGGLGKPARGREQEKHRNQVPVLKKAEVIGFIMQEKDYAHGEATISETPVPELLAKRRRHEIASASSLHVVGFMPSQLSSVTIRRRWMGLWR